MGKIMILGAKENSPGKSPTTDEQIRLGSKRTEVLPWINIAFERG